MEEYEKGFSKQMSIGLWEKDTRHY
jgi:hypothetical protein